MTSNQIEVFTKIPDAIAVLFHRGIFRQCEMFALDGGVFARTNGGFVRLLANNGTSNGFSVHKIVSNQPFPSDKFGRLTLPGEQ